MSLNSKPSLLKLAFDLYKSNHEAKKSVFSKVKKNPHEFVKQMPQMVLDLAKVRSQSGNMVCLLSNYKKEILFCIMEASLGPNWIKLFDLCLVDCGGPLFYKANTTFK